MYKAIVFAGTTEGYALCEFLAENHVPVYACAATEYGGSLLKENEFLHVSAGRLKTEDMEELFRREAPEIVLDATHPYAAEVTKISGLPVRTEAFAISVSFARRGRRTGSHLCGKHGEGGRASFRYRGEHFSYHRKQGAV